MAAEDQPKLVSQCASLYSLLVSQAKEIEGSNALVWEGKIIDTVSLVGITTGSYSRVINTLRTLGCLEQVEQGYRGRPSVYRLHYPPTPEVWRDHAPDRTGDLTSAPSSDTMAAAIKDLQSQIGGLNVVEAIVTLEQRIDQLQKEITEITRRVMKQPQ